MENPTAFDLNEAIRRWRAEFGSPSPLNAVELEELEAHLRDHVAALQGGGMTPEAAFRAAVKQLGDRQRVATEFAKINPQRVWLERAVWAVAGFLLFYVIRCLASMPSNVIFNYGARAQWDPILCFTASRLCYVVGVATMAVFCSVLFRRRPDCVGRVAHLCERRPVITGTATVVALWGIGRLSFYYLYIWERYLPQLYAWIMAATHANYPAQAMMNRMASLGWVAENVIWAAALCMLAAYALQTRERRAFSATADAQQFPANLLWLERLLWMVAGSMLVSFVRQNVVESGLRVVGRILPVPARGSLMLEQAHDLGMALLQLALWATSIWAVWIVATRRPELSCWIQRTLRHHPFKSATCVALLLHAGVIFWPLFFWAGVLPARPGRLDGYIGPEWYQWSSTLTNLIAPTVLLVALVRWRMKLREV